MREAKETRNGPMPYNVPKRESKYSLVVTWDLVARRMRVSSAETKVRSGVEDEKVIESQPQGVHVSRGVGRGPTRCDLRS